jgi:hypothetical protein
MDGFPRRADELRTLTGLMGFWARLLDRGMWSLTIAGWAAAHHHPWNPASATSFVSGGEISHGDSN